MLSVDPYDSLGVDTYHSVGVKTFIKVEDHFISPSLQHTTSLYKPFLLHGTLNLSGFINIDISQTDNNINVDIFFVIFLSAILPVLDVTFSSTFYWTFLPDHVACT